MALDYTGRIFSFIPSAHPFLNPYDNQPLIRELVILILFIVAEYLLVTRTIWLYSIRSRWAVLVDACLLIMIVLSIPVSAQLAFIYFQF